MARDIESLRVRVGDVPCDYLNMAHWKWECSRVDRNSDWYAGLAARRECRALGLKGLRVPPGSGGSPRVVEWVPDTDLSALRVVRVLDGDAKARGALKAELRTGDRVLVLDEWQGGERERRDERIEGPFLAGQPIVLTVDPRPGPNPALCIEVVGID